MWTFVTNFVDVALSHSEREFYSSEDTGFILLDEKRSRTIKKTPQTFYFMFYVRSLFCLGR